MVGFIYTFKDKLGQRGNNIFMKLETFLCYSQGEFCSATLKKKRLCNKFSEVKSFSLAC